MEARDDGEASVFSKGVWFAAEALGRAAALARPGPSPLAGSSAPGSLEEAIRRLKNDYEGTLDDARPYFLSGKMDAGLYAADCEFADPFVSFRGTKRFEDNLANLAGGFILDSSARVLNTTTDLGDVELGTPPSYTTRLMVKLQLNLPWKPMLAWPWGVEHVFDPDRLLIVKHIERWEVSPGEGVRQLLTASRGRGLQQGQPR